MKTKRKKQNSGLSLIEVMVAISVMLIAVIGAMGFRYYCTLDARKADIQVTATRLASMLLEDWAGNGGSSDYDPTGLAGLTSFSVSGESVGTTAPEGFNILGTYGIVASGVNYHAVLSYLNQTPDVPRTLNVIVAWPHKYPIGSYSKADGPGFYEFVKMTTYAN